MNLASLKDRIFRMTNHTYNDTFHMRDLVNSALTSLATEAKLEDEVTYYIEQGNATYPLPSGYKSARALVEGTIDNPLRIYQPITIDELGTGYAIWNGNIVMKPTPSQNAEVTLYFYKYPLPLENDADELDDAFTDYGDVVASYAAAMILSLPGTADSTKYLIDRYFATWEDGKRRFKKDRAKQNRQATVRVVNHW